MNKKRLLVLFCSTIFASMVLASCTEQNLNDDSKADETGIEKPKYKPPVDG
ncbi:MAG: hypothetical protein ACM31G_07080 [Flavobacteriales bacterium]